MAINSKSQFSKVSSEDAKKSLIEMLKQDKKKETKKKKEEVEKPTETDEIKQKQQNEQPEETQEYLTTQDLKDLFGSGFTPEEYKNLFEIYSSYSNNYPLRTAMHKMALIKVCKCTLRYNQALADNDLDSLKVWDAALSKALKEAKINPEQLSAADLSDGMTSFSQLSLAVEKAVDIIPVLPQFVENPKDRVDYTLWEYINYARHMEGKPLVEYKDIYNFLQVRYESLKKRYKFLKKEDDGQFDKNDLDSEV